MRAFVEVWDKAALVNLLGNRGNSVRVILGGNDGTLVTVDANGTITVTPPEGPGDPQTLGAITSICESVQTLGTKHHPLICQVLSEQMGALANQIIDLERQGRTQDSPDVKSLTRQLAEMEATYQSEGCDGPVKSTGPFHI
jgi:hypothetical protein